MAEMMNDCHDQGMNCDQILGIIARLEMRRCVGVHVKILMFIM